jgi:FtsH-binding integral membrane protein
MILSVQLCVTAGFVCVSVFSKEYRHFIRDNMWLFFVCMAVYLIVFYAMIYVRSLSRKVPVNFILLGLFTLAMSYIVTMTTAEFPPKTVMIAAILTCGIVLALTLYACTTKTDFTICGGLLFVLGFVLIIASIMAIFIRSRILEIVISAASVVVFSIYLVYDTQLILGKGELKLQIDDYIFAALNLYLDIVVIFLEILKLLGRN